MAVHKTLKTLHPNLGLFLCKSMQLTGISMFIIMIPNFLAWECQVVPAACNDNSRVVQLLWARLTPSPGVGTPGVDESKWARLTSTPGPSMMKKVSKFTAQVRAAHCICMPHTYVDVPMNIPYHSSDLIKGLFRKSIS